MKNKLNTTSRKKFIWLGTAVLAAIGSWKIFLHQKKNKKETAKMLTRDGHLVEIDKELITLGKKITDAELQHWIQK